MSWIATSRWVLLHLLRHPLAWLWLVVLACVWPAVAAFTPLGLTTSAGTETGTIYEIAFLSLLAGHLFGLHVLRSAGWFLAGAAPLRRATVELSALSAAAALFVACSLGLAWALGAPARGFGTGALPAGVLLAHLHLSAVALVLLRAPLPSAARLVALPMACWVVPALVAPIGAGGAWIRDVLDASRHVTFPSPGDPAEPQWIEALLPIIGLAGAATLLVTPGNALRHPR